MSNIVYTIDKNYFDLFKTSCISLINNTTIDLTINICTGINQFNDEEKNKIKQYFESIRNGVSIVFYEDIMLQNLKDLGYTYESHWFGDSIFIRLFLEKILKCNWVTVIDADTVIVKNIDSLIESEYEAPIAGTIDLNYQGNVEYPYICTGLYKTSLDYWRNNNIWSKVIALLPNKYEFPEQDIINIIFKYNKTVLPQKYCVSSIYKSATAVYALSNPSVIHFAGPNKPNQNAYEITTDWDFEWKKYNFLCKDLSL